MLDLSSSMTEESLTGSARLMCSTLEHRGPEASGIWTDAAAGIALGHQRLSILELSQAGCQPMISASGRLVVAFNGEIYNWQELRARLLTMGFSFRGRSDTEVLLASVEAWGLERALREVVGMFAFALWDRETRTLHLARDRMGEKPLFYGRFGPHVIFGSELKALAQAPGWRGEIDRGSVAVFLRDGFVPAPGSIYRGVQKLPPGTSLSIPLADRAALRAPVAYWSLPEAIARGRTNPFAGSPAEAMDELNDLLVAAVRGQMVADVPLGAFLSGGIDSSLVVALMQQSSAQRVRTFSIGFDEQRFNEAPHAKRVAEHLGTEHTELYVTSADALAVIPRLPLIYDEPFADSSQIPTFLLSALARRHVTVSLSGDGGDELFGGYDRYIVGSRIWKAIRAVPAPLRRAAGGMMSSVPGAVWDRIGDLFGKSMPLALRQPGVGDRIHKISALLGTTDAGMLHTRLMSHLPDPSGFVVDPYETLPAVDSDRLFSRRSMIERMMYADTVSYLPDDILVKVDRAAMAVSLETRVPFLDHRVVEFAWRLPLDLKVRGKEGKWILRQLAYRHVSRRLLDRPKMGFGMPVGEWLRGPLRPWAEELLDAGRLRREGFLNATAVRERWESHLSGSRNWQHGLWNILMFQAWLEQTTASGATERRMLSGAAA